MWEVGKKGSVVMSRARTTLVGLAVVLTVLGGAAWTEKAATTFQKAESSQNSQPLKITMSSVSPLLDRPAGSYRAGQQIPIAISLINTTNQAVYTCLSGDIYQDLPHSGATGSWSHTQNGKSTCCKRRRRNGLA